MKKVLTFFLFSFLCLAAFSQSNSLSGNGFSVDHSSEASVSTGAFRIPICGVCRTRHSPSCTPTPTPTPTPAPIDGGLSVLLAAGAAYGIRRFKNKNAA